MTPKIPNLASTILFRENRVDISNSAILYASERPLSVMTDSASMGMKAEIPESIFLFRNSTQMKAAA